jgi:hypothetical protein
VERNRNRDRGILDLFLHDPMASPLADRDESIPLEDPANLVP